jgi:hypothetical protein
MQDYTIYNLAQVLENSEKQFKPATQTPIFHFLVELVSKKKSQPRNKSKIPISNNFPIPSGNASCGEQMSLADPIFPTDI